ncbi:MAG: DUF624 domain-containing protein [Clostridiales Family XIII bacterium]|nr:DUF624 domain-containing protein [Clostridiales Family XIII bacterium]
MGNFFNSDNKIFQGLGQVTDLVLVNFLFVVCCIPVFTIGASWTALYTVTIKMVRDEDSGIVKQFFKAFKDNFKQATIIWLLFLVVGIGLVSYFLMFGRITGLVGVLIKGVLFLLALIYAMVLTFVFPVLSRFENKIKATIKNSFIIAVSNLPWTILSILIMAIPITITIIRPLYVMYGFLWVLIIFALYAFLSSIIFNRIFKKYMPPEPERYKD